MKKITLIIIALLLLIGCKNTNNTPTSKVEEFFSSYQTLNKDVLNDLDNIVSKDKTMSKEEKEEYKVLLEKQYQNLSYKIKNEEIIKNKAIVDTEIEVLDYYTTIEKVKRENKNEKTYQKEKLDALKQVNTKTKYNITFTLIKEDNNWKLDSLEKDIIKKIHGLYEK
ncbi:MAG: hypothetical protein IKG27_06525 [Bacilli bacterium]|nr:hypothetical protein [Bacilli bacterium]